MSLTVTIGGTGYGTNVQTANFKIEQVVSRRGDTTRLLVSDPGNALTIARFATVQVSDDQANLLFKGWATRIRQMSLSPTMRVWDLTCQDATLFLLSRIHNKVYTNAFVTDIARDMVLNAAYPTGITATNTPAGQGVVLPTFRVNRGKIATELTRLAKLAYNGQIWDWYVDYNQDLHFFYASQAPVVSVVLTDQDPPLPTGWYWYDRQSFFYETDDTQLGTVVTVRGGTYLSNAYTQTWQGNGVQTSFPFDYPPNTNAGPLPTVTVGGVSKTIAEDTGGTASTQWLLSRTADNKGATLKLGTDPTPGSGVTIQATYQYDLPILIRAQNQTQISQLASLPNGGVFERYVADARMTSKTQARQRATAELSAFGVSYVNAKVVVQDVATGAGGIGALQAGKKVRIINSQLGIDTTLLIVKCVIRSSKGQWYRYEVDLQG